ncbi:MAG TPA: SH3 domain-containing protein, partial [Saprospiraceae bacterium]|nr:SH3 domain-containing protein [Saprospiraceae bacterium]
MKTLIFKIISIFLLLISSQMKLVSQSINYAINDTMYVYAFNGLNIREQQNMKAKVIEKIDFGQKVEIIGIAENPNDNIIVIESLKGNWVRVKYNNMIGYAFDGYLSKLPNTPFPSTFPVFKHYDKANEDSYEGHQMKAELSKYIETYYKPLCETIEYFDPKKGKGGQKLEITKLQNGYTKIIKVGWEGYAMELLLPKI